MSNIHISCTPENADQLGRELLEAFNCDPSYNVSFSCFWNDPEYGTIIETYIEPCENVDILIVVGNDSNVIRINLTKLNNKLNPNKTVICYDVTGKGDGKSTPSIVEERRIKLLL